MRRASEEPRTNLERRSSLLGRRFRNGGPRPSNASEVFHQAIETFRVRIWSDGPPSRVEVEATDVFVGKPLEERTRLLDRFEPTRLHGGKVGGRAEMLTDEIVFRVAAMALHVAEDRGGGQASILARGRPDEGTDTQIGFIEMEDIDVIAWLGPIGHRQHLVRGGIGLMQAIAEQGVRLDGKEAEGGIVCPFEAERGLPLGHDGPVERDATHFPLQIVSAA